MKLVTLSNNNKKRIVMKKILSYVSLAITGLLMAACSEDFKDWASQKTYPQEDAITIPGYKASPANATGVDLQQSTYGDTASRP